MISFNYGMRVIERLTGNYMLVYKYSFDEIMTMIVAGYEDGSSQYCSSGSQRENYYQYNDAENNLLKPMPIAFCFLTLARSWAPAGWPLICNTMEVPNAQCPNII